MSESSTGDEALHGGASEDENLPGTTADDVSGSEEGDKPAAPPTAEDDKKPKDLAAAVRAALAPKEGQSSGSGEDEGEGAGEAADDPTKAKAKEGEEEELGELTDEELNSYKPKTQRRMRQLLKQSETLTAEVSALRPMAEGFQTIQAYTKKENLTREDVNTGFNIMALMKNNPVEAFNQLKPIYETLQQIVGEVLPADLQTRVASREITQEAAQELSRLRAKEGLTVSQQRQQETRATEQQTRERQVQATNALKETLGTAVTEWENRWKASDPDYSLKHSRVSERMELELLKMERTGQFPRDAQAAHALMDRIKTAVDADMKKLLPKKTPITHVSGNGATNNSKPKPKSIHDAVAQAVGYH